MTGFRQIMSTNRAMDGKLKSGLRGADAVRVDSRLHGLVMSRVRNADHGPRVFAFNWAAAAAAVVALAFAVWMIPASQTGNQPGVEAPAGAGYDSLQGKLAQLENGPMLPEAALRAELQRLKSDLRKLGIDS